MATVSKSEIKATDATRLFFEGLAERGHEPFLHGATGTLRVELRDGNRVEHWYVTVREGDVAVSHRNARADSVVRADRALFDSIAVGMENAIAATLRGSLVVEGDLGLVTSFQRLFPGPRSSRRTRSSGRRSKNR